MTFLNPLVLLGLIAAAIPVILHLLNLRKLRTIEFSTLTFLKELQQTKIRRLKLRQILLLITRTLLVIFIILAFARPAMRGTWLGNIGAHAHSSIAIIFDDSFSMMASDEHGVFFKKAKEAAFQVIDLLKEGDEVFFIKLSDLPKATIDPATHDFDGVRRIVNEAQISMVRRPMEDALRLAAKLLQHSANANREVYIISDMQETLFKHFMGIHPFRSSKSQASSLFNEQTNIFLIQLGSKEASNVAIDSLNVITKILEKDKPVTIFTSIRNHGKAPINNYVISVHLDGVKAAQKNVSVEAGGSTTCEFLVSPKRTGFIRGYIELENDAIEPDNKRYFTLYIPEQISITIISSSEPETQFLLLALTTKDEQGMRSSFNINRVTPQKFPTLNLNNVDILICTNIKVFNSNDAQRIKDFVAKGGGVVLFAEDKLQPANYNSLLLPILGIPPIETITEIDDQNHNLSFNKIDFDHPIFSTIFEKEQSGKKQERQTIESPNVFKSIKRQAGKQARTIISLSDGTPFLTEHEIGTGKILFYSIAPILSWSDFPLKGIFVPLIYRSMIYTAPHEFNQSNYITGDDPIIIVQSGSSQKYNFQSSDDKRYKIISPDGLEEFIQPNFQSGVPGSIGKGFSFQSNRLTLPGFYDLKSGSNTLSISTVNVDPLEAHTRKISNDNLEKFFAQIGVDKQYLHSLQASEKVQGKILEARFGTELWKLCIGFALFLALIEMLIAKDRNKTAQEVKQ
ncbi:MAG: BatA and WFA domain-containing protein [Bacteroidota bacterium]|nr:BatA and WFA domain-containing protein [Bacteroidota bacterium]